MEWSEASERFVERSIRLAPGATDDSGNSSDGDTEDECEEITKENRLRSRITLGLNNTVSVFYHFF